MTRSVVAIAAVAWLGSAPAPGLANPINLVAARSVDIGHSGGSVLAETSAATGIFNKGVSHPAVATNGGLVSVSASQSTLIDAASGLFSGTGSASIGYSMFASTGAYADSFFDVFFDLTTPHAFALSGTLMASDDGGFARAVFDLSGPTALSWIATSSISPIPVLASGTLPAGSYHVVVRAKMDNGGNTQDGAAMGGMASFDFSLALSQTPPAIPEPTTISLLGLGLAGSALQRRRRR